MIRWLLPGALLLASQSAPSAQRTTEVGVRPNAFYAFGQDVADERFVVVPEWSPLVFTWVSLFVHDVDARETWRLGRVFDGGGDWWIDGRHAALRHLEEGVDLNGNGRVNDPVWLVWDLHGQRLLPSLAARDDGQLAHGLFVGRVDEVRQGADVDGDGVLSVTAQVAWELDTGALHPLPPGTANPHVGTGFVVFRQWEPAAGDLNGDGDLDDWIPRVFVPGLPLLESEVALGKTSGTSPFQVGGGLVTFLASEQDQGGVDLNNDGDEFDRDVLQVVDVAARRTTNVGWSADPITALAPPYVWFAAEESVHGDLNGDGDVGDQVLFVHDALRGSTRNLGLQLPPSGLAGADVEPQGRFLALAVREADLGLDLTGDGDLLDRVATLADGAKARVWFTGLAGDWRGMGWLESGYLVLADEGHTRQDFNGDGDTWDRVLHFVDPVAARVHNSRLAPPTGVFERHVARWRDDVVFALRENQEAADLNGDGDQLDDVLHRWSQETGQLVNLGLAVPSTGGLPFLRSAGERQREVDYLPLIVDEDAQSADLDADGQLGHQVLHYLDLATGRVRNGGLAFGGGSATVGWIGTTRADVHALVDEQALGVDLNRDGLLRAGPRVHVLPAPFRRPRAYSPPPLR